MKRIIATILLLIISVCGMAQRITPLDPQADKLFMKNYRDTLDAVIKMAIDSACFPGCQVFATINGRVVVNKAYGHFSYTAVDSALIRRRVSDSLSRYHAQYPSLSTLSRLDDAKTYCLPAPYKPAPTLEEMEAMGPRLHKVKCSDIYDIASLTKVSATTLMVMSLVDKHLMGTARPLGAYLKNPYPKESKVLGVTIRSLLEHRSGIKSYTPITRFNNSIYGWKINCRTLGIAFDSISPEEIAKASFNEIFRTGYQKGVAERRVAEGVWMKKNYEDSLRRFFFEQGMNRRKRYQYSDINMVYLQWAAEAASKTTLDQYMNDNFYKPLGMETTGFLPLKRFDRERIAPTEAHQWTGEMLQGDVHDPTAALLGGVSGNAGIFSSAQDLGILFQMLLNRGEYNGKRYLESATVDRFTMRQPNTYRGLGFDMVPSSFASSKAGSRTFGHTGFTGTCAWADPDNQIVIVFLSNRVHPSQTNNKINTLKIRQKICNAIYDGCGVN